MRVDNPLLIEVSESLNVNPKWLWSLIQFESKWNPQAKNPNSSARGLIQFIDSTAQSLGYKNSLDLVTKNPTAEQQLFFPVYQYLSQFAPFPTEQSLYLSVFYPAARNWALHKEFPKNVQAVNTGIVTVNDYINRVRGVKYDSIVKGLMVLCVGILVIKKFI